MGKGVLDWSENYKKLYIYQKAELIFDLNAIFCERFIDKKSRTYDQMIQAARSGKQNIVEGCSDGVTSKKTQLKLIGVSRGSYEELLNDYFDFLRVNEMEIWNKEDPRTKKIRYLGMKATEKTQDGKEWEKMGQNGKRWETMEGFGKEWETMGNEREWAKKELKGLVKEGSPEVAANVIICLICQEKALIDGYLNKLEQKFLEEGGITERMYRTRVEIRSKMKKKEWE